MLKNILNLKGSQKLTSKEQKAIKGGIRNPNSPTCLCAQVNWGTSQDPGENNGVGMTFSTTYSEGAIPVGWVYVVPQPTCCQ